MSKTKTTRRKVSKQPHRDMEQMIMENLPILSRSMTFSKMLQLDKSAVSIIRKWPWFFPPLCHRKDQASLTDIEKSRYICAFYMVNNDGAVETKSGASLPTFCSVFAAVRSRFQKLCLERNQ
jgi:hypothetical protein